jgi:hypothetical protein
VFKFPSSLPAWAQPPTVVTITGIAPAIAAVQLWQIQNWEEDVQGDPAQVVFSASGMYELPNFVSMLTKAKTIQQDLLLDGSLRCVGVNPKVVTVQWFEHPLGESAPTNRSRSGLLEMLPGTGSVGGQITRSFRLWVAQQVYSKGNTTPYWSAP